MNHENFFTQLETKIVMGEFDLSHCAEELYDRNFNGVKFIDCKFVNGDFASCSFIDCVFKNVLFEMTEMAGVSFENCQMDGFRMNNDSMSFTIR